MALPYDHSVYFKNYPQTFYLVIINEATEIFKTGQGKILKASSSALCPSVSHTKLGLCSQVWIFSDSSSPKSKPQSPVKAKALGKEGCWLPGCLGACKAGAPTLHIQLSNQLSCFQPYTSCLLYEVSCSEALSLSKSVQGILGPLFISIILHNSPRWASFPQSPLSHLHSPLKRFLLKSLVCCCPISMFFGLCSLKILQFFFWCYF